MPVLLFLKENTKVRRMYYDFICHTSVPMIAGTVVMFVLSMVIFAGGKGLNQSVALAKSGIDTWHAGNIGEDGEFLAEILQKAAHTINNLDNVVENTTTAESRIRDTDMAEEMVNYSKNNILTQAEQSMLAQANQSNQGVLSRLQ